MTGKRHYYRCEDCLSVAACDEWLLSQDAYGRSTYGRCGACGGPLEYMGQVEKTRLVTEELRCPCDERCTNARGPSCDCRCGGANHGSGMVVAVVRDAGAAPKLAMDPNAGTRGQEYRELALAARNGIGRKYARVLMMRANGDYLQGGDWPLYMRAQRLLEEIREIKALRVYKTRNAKLLAFCENHKIELPPPVAVGLFSGKE